MKKLLEKLCQAFAPSGFEGQVRNIIEEEISKTSLENTEILSDNLGGICLHIKNEGKKKLMICAHIDEVGFMVTEITESGTLKFGCVGGINPLVLSSKTVVSENGVRGVISTKPIHLLDAKERKVRPEISNMRINIGAKDKKDAEKLVSVGDYFVFDSAFESFGKNQIKAKAIDDRHGCTAMLYAIKELAKSGKKSDYDLYFAFTCREEVGVSGAWCITEIVKPDFAIVIESKAVCDLPSVSEDECVGKLGEGALISYADLGAIMDRELTNKIISVCEKNKIKYQINRAVSGGNDTSNIQRGAYGAKVALISAPSRYIHSSANVINYEDFESICKAIYSFITEKED